MIDLRTTVKAGSFLGRTQTCQTRVGWTERRIGAGDVAGGVECFQIITFCAGFDKAYHS